MTPRLQMLASSTGNSPRAQIIMEEYSDCNSRCAWTILFQNCKQKTVEGIVILMPEPLGTPKQTASLRNSQCAFKLGKPPSPAEFFSTGS